MQTHLTEVFDLALTQAIERYIEMEPQAAHEAITREWPEQIAVLIAEFLFNSFCGDCGGMAHFVEIERENGHSNYFIPLCACERRQK
ncbi:MAG: hypothetical protein P4N59_05575 [Negativicutes bacterium]|nr:hypothetical protein [Negativicutes bacterium]